MSTSFFEYGADYISVSKSIWIYFIISAFLTASILGGLAYWITKRDRASISGDEEVPRAKTEVKGKEKVG